MKKFNSLLLCLLLLTACSTETSEIKKKSGDVTSSISAGSMTDEELKETLERVKAEEDAMLKEKLQSATTIEFDKLKHDFGNVLPDSDNETVFTVTNTGERPLIIDDVSASCGCTMPQKPEGPILPGESDVIEVVFHPKPGQVNEIIKSITVTANTEEKIHMLEIRAFVKK